MKVLIVDDNVAIQEILSEVLSVDGYVTSAASSLSDAAAAIETSRPDAVLLDSTVGDEDGYRLLDMMLAKGIQLSNVLVLTLDPDGVPKDNPSIAGIIQKPFKSTEILEKVRGLFAESPRDRPKRSLFRSLFGKKDHDVQEDDMELKFGSSYLFIEPEARHAYRAASQLMDEGCDVMVVTSGRIKAAVEKMDGSDVRVIALSAKDGPDYVEPERIGTLMGMMTDFIGTMDEPVVMMDDLDLLMERNGANSVLTMIHQTINNGLGKKMTLIASAASDDMTEKDRELLQNSMEIKVFG